MEREELEGQATATEELLLAISRLTRDSCYRPVQGLGAQFRVAMVRSRDRRRTRRSRPTKEQEMLRTWHHVSLPPCALSLTLCVLSSVSRSLKEGESLNPSSGGPGDQLWMRNFIFFDSVKGDDERRRKWFRNLRKWKTKVELCWCRRRRRRSSSSFSVHQETTAWYTSREMEKWRKRNFVFFLGRKAFFQSKDASLSIVSFRKVSHLMLCSSASLLLRHGWIQWAKEKCHSCFYFVVWSVIVCLCFTVWSWTLCKNVTVLLLFCSMKKLNSLQECHSCLYFAVWSATVDSVLQYEAQSLMSQSASVLRYEEAQVSTRMSELLASKDTASNTCCHREKLVLQNTILLKYSSLYTSCWSLEMLHAASMCADDNEDICRSCTAGVLQL